MKRHQLDLFSMIAGLAFVTIAVLYLLDATGQLDVNGRLVIPLLLIALGVGGLAGALYRMARGTRQDPPRSAATAPVPAPEPASVGAAAPARAETRTETRSEPRTGQGFRYDDLSSDLEALGLLDDPATGSGSSGPAAGPEDKR